MRTMALEAEKIGYDSVWTTDHILMPTQSGTPYEKILESITSLAYLAAHTSTVKLGISSLIMAMRNPVVVAKQLATLDEISGGRVMLATSAGWVEKEFNYLGSDFHTRKKTERVYQTHQETLERGGQRRVRRQEHPAQVQERGFRTKTGTETPDYLDCRE